MHNSGHCFRLITQYITSLITARSSEYYDSGFDYIISISFQRKSQVSIELYQRDFKFEFSHDLDSTNLLGPHSSLKNLLADVYKAADGFGLLQDAAGKYMRPEDFLGIEPLTNHYIHDPTENLYFLLR